MNVEPISYTDPYGNTMQESPMGESYRIESPMEECVNDKMCSELESGLEYYADNIAERQEIDETIKRAPGDFKDIIDRCVRIIKGTYTNFTQSLTNATMPYIQCSVDDVVREGIFERYGKETIHMYIQAHGEEDITKRLKHTNEPYKVSVLSVVGANLCGIMKRCTNGFEGFVNIKTITEIKSDDGESTIVEGEPQRCGIFIPMRSADTRVYKDGKKAVYSSGAEIIIRSRISLDLMLTAATSQFFNFCKRYNVANKEHSYISEDAIREALVDLQTQIYKSCDDTIDEFADEIYPELKTSILRFIEPQCEKYLFYIPNKDENEVHLTIDGVSTMVGEYGQKMVPIYGLFVIKATDEQDNLYSLSNTMEYIPPYDPRAVLPGRSESINTGQFKNQSELNYYGKCDEINCITTNINAYNILWDSNVNKDTPMYWLNKIDDRLKFLEHYRVISPTARTNLINYWIINMNVVSPQNFLTEIILYFGIILGYSIDLLDPSCRNITDDAAKFKCYELAHRNIPSSTASKSSYLLNRASLDISGTDRYIPPEAGWLAKTDSDNRARIQRWLSILSHDNVADMLDSLRTSNKVCSKFANVVRHAQILAKMPKTLPPSTKKGAETKTVGPDKPSTSRRSSRATAQTAPYSGKVRTQTRKSDLEGGMKRRRRNSVKRSRNSLKRKRKTIKRRRIKTKRKRI